MSPTEQDIKMYQESGNSLLRNEDLRTKRIFYSIENGITMKGALAHHIDALMYPGEKTRSSLREKDTNSATDLLPVKRELDEDEDSAMDIDVVNSDEDIRNALKNSDEEEENINILRRVLFSSLSRQNDCKFS